MERLTLAALDERGSSKSAHILGLSLCQQLMLFNSTKSSSTRWNFLRISSSVGFSVSMSRRSSAWSVSCVSRCVVYVIQQHGSTWKHIVSLMSQVRLLTSGYSIDTIRKCRTTFRLKVYRSWIQRVAATKRLMLTASFCRRQVLPSCLNILLSDRRD